MFSLNFAEKELNCSHNTNYFSQIWWFKLFLTNLHLCLVALWYIIPSSYKTWHTTYCTGCNPFWPFLFRVNYVGGTITALFCKSLILKVSSTVSWSLLMCLVLIVGSHLRSNLQLADWHREEPGLVPIPLSICVECCSRHCNLDLLPQQVRLEGGDQSSK